MSTRWWKYSANQKHIPCGDIPVVHCLSPADLSFLQTAGLWFPFSSSAYSQMSRPLNPSRSPAVPYPDWKLEDGEDSYWRGRHSKAPSTSGLLQEQPSKKWRQKTFGQISRMIQTFQTIDNNSHYIGLCSKTNLNPPVHSHTQPETGSKTSVSAGRALTQLWG